MSLCILRLGPAAGNRNPTGERQTLSLEPVWFERIQEHRHWFSRVMRPMTDLAGPEASSKVILTRVRAGVGTGEIGWYYGVLSQKPSFYLPHAV